MTGQKINRSTSFDYPISAQNNQRVQPAIAQNLQQPRRGSFHRCQAPLAGAPAQPQSSYQEFLRYHPKETARVVLQETVDRQTQKNLSRNTKEVLTGETRFWDDGAADAKGNIGLGRVATTLKQLTLHRDRLDLIDHASIQTSRAKLAALVSAEHDRLRARHPDRAASQQAEVEFNRLMTEAKRGAVDVLTVLDFQIETLQSRALKGRTSREDRAALAKLKQYRNQVQTLITDAFRKPGGVNNYGVYQSAQQGLARLDRYLVRYVKPQWEHLPIGLEALRTQDAITKAAKPVVQTLSGDDKTRRQQSERLNKLSTVLKQAVDGGLVKLSMNNRLAGLSKSGNAQLNLIQHVNEQTRRLSYAKAILAAHSRNVDLGMDTVLFPPELRNADAETYADFILTGLVERDRADLFRVVDEKIAETNGVDRPTLEAQYDQDNKATSCARVILAAHKQGIVVGLNDNQFPPQLRDGDTATYAAHIGNNIDDNARAELYRIVDEKIAAWKSDYQSLSKTLRPKNRFQRSWLGKKLTSFKNWFSKSTSRKTATELNAFATEFVLASKESHEALVEQAEQADHPGMLDHDAPEHIDTASFTAKDWLHVNAIGKNLDDGKQIREHRAHLKHQVHHAKEKLEEQEAAEPAMNAVDRYRSGIVKAVYKKTGAQSAELALNYTEEAVADTQVARHLSSMVHDSLVKANVIGTGVTVAGVGGLGGAAAAEYTEGIIGAGKAINAQVIKSHLENRIKEVRKELTQAQQNGNHDLVESLKFQERTLKDLSDQQERMTNTLSSMKGFGMGTGYTLLLLTTLGVASTGVAAPVLLAVFAGTQIGLKSYKVAKASHQSWKIDRTEDLILGRGGSQKFLDDIAAEAARTGATPAQVALTRICRGKGPNAKRPSSRKLLNDLKWECKDARIGDDEIRTMQSLQNQVKNHKRWMDQAPAKDVYYYRQKMNDAQASLDDLRNAHTERIMSSSTAKTLRDAYRMSEEEIAAIVDAPNDDRHDEFGIRLISTYQNEISQ